MSDDLGFKETKDDSSNSHDELGFVPHDEEKDPLLAGKKISKIESALRGGLQGASLGYADELAGAGEAGLDTVTGKVEPSFEKMVEAYKKHRDESRSKFKEAEEANPMSYLGGTIAGGIAPVALSGGLGAGIKGGALLGGLAGAGTSNEDLTSDKSLKEKAMGLGTDVAIGAGTGAALSAIPAAGKAIKKSYPGKLFAQELAGNKVLGSEAREQIGDKLVQNAGQIGQDIQKAMNDAALNKTTLLDELTKAGKKYSIEDIQQALAEGKKSLPTSFTKEGDAARNALDEPFSRARMLGEVDPSEATNIEDLMSTRLNPKQLDSFRRALGNLGYEKDLKDDQVIALAKRLSGKTAEKLNYDVNPETGELMKNPVGKVNAKIKDLMEAQNIFNTSGKGLDELGNERAITPILQRLESEGMSSDIARSQFKKGIESLKSADPELANNISNKASNLAEQYTLSREAAKDINPLYKSGQYRLGLNAAGYTGRGLHAADKALGGVPSAIAKPVGAIAGTSVKSTSGATPAMVLQQDINSTSAPEKDKFSDLSPERLMGIAQRLRGQGIDGIANKVEKAAQSNDPREKAQAEFVIKQNPAARRHIENPNEEEE